MLQPWLAEMDLAVDPPGQNVQAGAVDDLARIGSERPDRGDLATDDADIRRHRATGQVHRAVLDDKVEASRHVRLRLISCG